MSTIAKTEQGKRHFREIASMLQLTDPDRITLADQEVAALYRGLIESLEKGPDGLYVKCNWQLFRIDNGEPIEPRLFLVSALSGRRRAWPQELVKEELERGGDDLEEVEEYYQELGLGSIRLTRERLGRFMEGPDYRVLRANRFPPPHEPSAELQGAWSSMPGISSDATVEIRPFIPGWDLVLQRMGFTLIETRPFDFVAMPLGFARTTPRYRSVGGLMLSAWGDMCSLPNAGEGGEGLTELEQEFLRYCWGMDDDEDTPGKVLWYFNDAQIEAVFEAEGELKSLIELGSSWPTLQIDFGLAEPSPNPGIFGGWRQEAGRYPSLDERVADHDITLARFLECEELAKMLCAFVRRGMAEEAYEVARHLVEHSDSDQDGVEAVVALAIWSGDVELLVRAVKAHKVRRTGWEAREPGHRSW